jgi:hypothetical protein
MQGWLLNEDVDLELGGGRASLTLASFSTNFCDDGSGHGAAQRSVLGIVLFSASISHGGQKGRKGCEDAAGYKYIGPHKTATTSIQAMLRSANSIENMQGENTYWIQHSEEVQFSKSLLKARQDFDDVAQMGRFFNE